MIKIKKNPNGDTRTAPKNVSFEDFQEANDMHISDVSYVMYELSRMIDNRGMIHDCTKNLKKNYSMIIFYLQLTKVLILQKMNGIRFTLMQRDIIYFLNVQMM